MKFGQVLSVLESALPEDVRGAVPGAPDPAAGLRAPDADPDGARGDRARAGAGLARQLVKLDGGPTAAASIGQVHRGTWHDGREVAVKVQYPGAGDALLGDLKQLARLARACPRCCPGWTSSR